MIPKWKSNLAVLLRFRSTTSISSCVENLAQSGSRLQNKVSKSKHFLSDLISIQQPSSYHLRRNDNGRLLERPSGISCQGPCAKQRTFKTLIKTFLFKESFQLS